MPTATAYGDATLQQVIGPPLVNASVLQATAFDHVVFFNRGSVFEAVALPPAAQLAPAFAVAAADLDGDGAEDLFLSQNFFPTEPGGARLDAGRGLWLRGDGAGGLTPVPGQLSGITVYGDQRGAALADYDQDGRVDLVVTQNGAETKLYRNAGARPGLRVRLVGPVGNPDAVGASLRLVTATGRGPVREIQAGSGYWSQHAAVQVLGDAQRATGVWVRWPGGTETEVPVAPGSRELTIRMPNP